MGVERRNASLQYKQWLELGCQLQSRLWLCSESHPLSSLPDLVKKLKLILQEPKYCTKLFVRYLRFVVIKSDVALGFELIYLNIWNENVSFQRRELKYTGWTWTCVKCESRCFGKFLSVLELADLSLTRSPELPIHFFKLLTRFFMILRIDSKGSQHIPSQWSPN